MPAATRRRAVSGGHRWLFYRLDRLVHFAIRWH